MKTTYDKIADALYITLKKGKVSNTLKLSDRLIIDLDKNGNTLGIEILDTKNQLEKQALEKIPSSLLIKDILTA